MRVRTRDAVSFQTALLLWMAGFAVAFSPGLRRPLTAVSIRTRPAYADGYHQDHGALVGQLELELQSQKTKRSSLLLQSAAESEFTTTSPFATTTNNNNHEYSFFDEVSIYVRAGSGGQGSSTYKKAKKSQNGIPDGGSGGPGGNIVFEVDASLNTLASFTGGGGSVNDNHANSGNVLGTSSNQRQPRLMSFRAETGHPGGRMYDNGRKGDDCIVRVPPGTVVSIEHESIAEGADEAATENDIEMNDTEESDTDTPLDEEDRDSDLELPVLTRTDIGTLSL